MKRTLQKQMTMKNIVIIFALMFIFVVSLFGQDKCNSTRITFDSAQEGFPTWSPDGKFIVYQHSSREDSLGKNGLWKMTADGKGAQQIFAGVAEHPKWSPDDRYIVFNADTGKSIKMIPVKGGAPIHILPDSIHILHGGSPCWSPDGSKIAFVEGSTLTLYTININNGELIKIFQGEGNVPLPACWTPDGKYVLTALMELPSRKSTIWKISSEGKENKQITGHHEMFYLHMGLSPDGSLLVYAAMVERNLGLWIMPAEGGKSIQIVSHPGYNEGPCWSPNGTKIAFTSTRSGNFDIWVMDINSGQIKKELQILHE